MIKKDNIRKINFFWKSIIQGYFNYILLFFVYVYSFIYLIIPFLRYNNLLTYDSAGLFFSSWYYRMYLFPSVVGWNPFFFGGYPQNQFYSPLFSYLTAGFSYVFGLEISFKILLVLLIFLVPLSFYYFSRAFKLEKNIAAIVSLIMFTLLFMIPYEFYGGNFHSTFNVGLISHFLGFVLFFFYFGSLINGYKDSKFILSSILFSLIIMAHVFSAIAAAFAFLAFFISMIRDKNIFNYSIKHLGLVFLLTSFWTIPFLFKSGYSNGLKIGNLNFLYLFLAGGIAYIIYAFYYREKAEFLSVPFFVVLLSLFCFVLQFTDFTLHYYRFTMFLLLCFPVLIFSFMKREKFWILSITLFICMFFLFNVSDLHPAGISSIKSAKFDYETSGRIMIIASLGEQDSPHELYHKIPIDNEGSYLRGLYVESSKNSNLVMDLEREIKPFNTLVWGISTDDELIAENSYLLDEILPYQFKVFGINYVIAHEPFYYGKEVSKLRFDFYGDNNKSDYDYGLFKVGENNIIEVLDRAPRVVENNWDDEVAKWFLSEEVISGILVNEKVPGFVGNKNENVEILEMSKRGDYIKFKVESEDIVPIYLKISDFPNWHAYNEGKELKIFKASPYFMLVYGKGEVELIYKNNFVDYFSYFLSFIGLILLIYLIKFQYWKSMKRYIFRKKNGKLQKI